ncbi:unnamed protein product [Blepharisma stoltei]|uniref:Uncharacterized protein n=1 Tax=Blepharisma stoltei TaxID=1481888 RepID=A0AAU9K0T4_9CILI|nr:unnamed protein product [Blepharisma stoltei]
MINSPKCYISQCTSKPYGKCDCSAQPVIFCKSHALQHIEDIENEKRHRCLKVYFKPDSDTKNLINQKLIEMKESLQNFRTKLIRESKEIVEVVRHSLDKALSYVNDLEEKFNKLIDETRSEEVYESPSENDFESIFKLSPSKAELKLKDWQLLITNIDSNSIKENVKDVMNLSAPVFFKMFYDNRKSSRKSSITAEIFWFIHWSELFIVWHLLGKLITCYFLRGTLVR